MKNLVVMLPTLDEEFGLREVLPAIPIDELTNLGWQTEVWVIDGGSSDSSIEIANNYDCKVFKQAVTAKVQQ